MNASLSRARGSVALIILVVVTVLIGLAFVSNRQARVGAPETTGSPAVSEADKALFQLAASAEATSTILIGNCSANPAVAQVVLGGSVKFKNTDKTAHIISFDPKHMFALGGGKSLPVTFDFWQKPGLRSYNCDEKTNAGTIYATLPMTSVVK